MSTILDKVKEQGYLPDAKTLEEFLSLIGKVRGVDRQSTESYWKILQAKAKNYGSIVKAHEELYPLVLLHCTDESMTSKERNASTNFARSAFSTLRSYLESHNNKPFPTDLYTVSKSDATKKIKEHRDEQRKANTPIVVAPYTAAFNGMWASVRYIPLGQLESDLKALHEHRKAMETK
jgi:hypothetical protein